jgi:hypothetical protein
MMSLTSCPSRRACEVLCLEQVVSSGLREPLVLIWLLPAPISYVQLYVLRQKQLSLLCRTESLCVGDGPEFS